MSCSWDRSSLRAGAVGDVRFRSRVPHCFEQEVGKVLKHFDMVTEEMEIR